MTTTNIVSDLYALTLGDIEHVVKKLEKNSRKDWTLVSPTGRVWQGTPEQMMLVLMPHHNLLKPLTPTEIFAKEKQDDLHSDEH